VQTLISRTFLSRSLEYLLDFQLADVVTIDTRKLCLRIHVMANLQRDEFPSSHPKMIVGGNSPPTTINCGNVNSNEL
jgi:hypothetical protein